MITQPDISPNVHYLYPAEIFASKEPSKVLTILGSYVSVCFWDPYLETGGVNHFMLPLWNRQGLPTPKYGNIAIERLLRMMLSLGCKKENIRAKVYGGGNVIQLSYPHLSIGSKNVEVARHLLKQLKIKIVSSDTGGYRGRKILFNTRTGELIHRYIEKL